MNSDTKDNIMVVAAIALILAIIAVAWYVIANNLLGAVLTAIVAIVLVIAVILVILHVVLGTFYFFKKKDKAHNEYTSTLDDIKEVKGEMDKDKP